MQHQMSLRGASPSVSLALTSSGAGLVRKEIYYTVWFNTKSSNLKLFTAVASANLWLDGVLNQTIE